MTQSKGTRQIGLRLRGIARAVCKGHAAADIGTDHAQLALYLLDQQIVPRMVITELQEGPYQKALHAASASPWSDRIEVRLGDGLQPLRASEVSSVIIAGLGGDVMAGILSYDWAKAESFNQYILQAMSRPGTVRRLLAERGWPIVDEYLIYERGRSYVIIKTHPGKSPYNLTPLEIDLGPVVLTRDFLEIKPYLSTCLRKYQMIMNGYEQAALGFDNVAYTENKSKITVLEALINGSKS